MFKKAKKISAAVLSAVMMLTAVATPLGDNLPAVRESTSLTAGAVSIDENYVWNKIKELKELFPTGSYFTKNGKNSCHTNVVYKSNYSYCYSMSCPDCKLENVLIYNSKAKNTVVPNVCKHKARYSCCGFATFVFCYIFEHDTEENITKFSSSAYGGINDNFLSKLKPGDFITCDNGSHYAVFLGYDKSNIYLYESNYDSPNQVEYYHARSRNGLKWSKFEVKRSNSYSDNGGVIAKTTDHYKLTSPDGYQTIRKEASTSSANLGSINAGNVVCVTTYSSDNKWGYITYNGISGWIRLYYVEKTGSSHSYGSWYTTTSATCTSGGTEERKCSCGATETRSTSALGHDYGSTYFEADHPHKYAHLCQRCGYKEFTGGNLDYYYLCATCTHLTKPEVTKITGDLVDNSEITIEWTASESDKLANYWLDVFDPDGQNVVDVSTGKINSYTFTPVKTGTYTIKTYAAPIGNKDGSGSVGAETTIEIGCNHNYITEIVNPTYDNEGYTLHTCTKCGYSYKDTYTAKLTLAKVTGVKLTGRAADAVRVNWTKNANADGYIVEMYQGNKWVRVAKITSNNTTTFRKAGLNAGTVYKFRVRAYKMVGKTALYSEYSATVAARTNPSVIKGAKLTGRVADALRINWTKNASADGYIVEMYKGGKWVRAAKITNNSTTTFRKAGLKASTVYKFRVRAYKMSGKTALYGNYSATVTARTNPSIVKGVTAAVKTSKAIALRWDKNTSAQGYIVEMYKGGKWVRAAKITDNGKTLFKKAGLKANTVYRFRVKAYHMSGKTALYGNYGSVSGKTAAK